MLEIIFILTMLKTMADIIVIGVSIWAMNKALRFFKK